MKIMSNKSYNEIVSRINNAAAEIEATVKSKNAEIQGLERDLEIVKKREQELKNSFNGQTRHIEILKTKIHSCKAMRHDLENKLEKLKADLKKQGDELAVKSDELKRWKRQFDTASSELKQCQIRYADAADIRAILLEGINAAMAEMRKVNRGKPSHNKSRAFQHLEKALAAYNAAQPKSSLPENAAPEK